MYLKFNFDEACRFGLAAQEQGYRFVQERLGEFRIALDALDHCLPEVAGECHVDYLFSLSLRIVAAFAFFRALYSACNALLSLLLA
jgi:hypothetical protein